MMSAEERKLWLEERRKGIGSSDIAAICGLSPWGSPLEVYLDKVGLLPEREEEHLTWGLRLEDVIAAAFEEAVGYVAIPPSTTLFRHPHYPHCQASPDRLLFPRSGDKAILELKNVSDDREWGEVGTDQVPDWYNLQAQWQMFVLGLLVCFFGVLIRGRQFRWYRVEGNQEIQEQLLRISQEFWLRVLTRNPPEPDWQHPDTPRLVGLLRKPDPVVTIQGGAEFSGWADEYDRLGFEIRELKAEQARVKARMVFEMGGAGRCNLLDGRAVERVTRSRKGYTVDPCEYEDFRIVRRRDVNTGGNDA